MKTQQNRIKPFQSCVGDVQHGEHVELPELFSLLGLGALSEDQKVLIRDELEQVVYKRMMVRLLQIVPEESRVRAVDAMKKGDSAAALEQLIPSVDMQSLVIDEVGRVRRELSGTVHRVVFPSADAPIAVMP